MDYSGDSLFGIGFCLLNDNLSNNKNDGTQAVQKETRKPIKYKITKQAFAKELKASVKLTKLTCAKNFLRR